MPVADMNAQAGVNQDPPATNSLPILSNESMPVQPNGLDPNSFSEIIISPNLVLLQRKVPNCDQENFNLELLSFLQSCQKYIQQLLLNRTTIRYLPRSSFLPPLLPKPSYPAVVPSLTPNPSCPSAFSSFSSSGGPGNMSTAPNTWNDCNTDRIHNPINNCTCTSRNPPEVDPVQNLPFTPPYYPPGNMSTAPNAWNDCNTDRIHNPINNCTCTNSNPPEVDLMQNLPFTPPYYAPASPYTTTNTIIPTNNTNNISNFTDTSNDVSTTTITNTTTTRSSLNRSGKRKVHSKSRKSTAVKSKPESHKRHSRCFDDGVQQLLLSWIIAHKHHPYCSKEEKRELAKKTGLDEKQITMWMINKRRRNASLFK